MFTNAAQFKNHLLLLIFSIFLCPTLSLGADEFCHDTPKIEMGRIRYQSDSTYCFANVAADLFGYAFRQELNYQQVSPIQIAFNYARSYSLIIRKKYDAADGGLIRLGILQALGEGACLQSVEDQMYFENKSEDFSAKIKFIDELKKAYDDGDGDKFAKMFIKMRTSDSILSNLHRETLLYILSHTSKKNVGLKLMNELCRSNTFYPNRMATRHSVDLTSHVTKLTIGGNKTLFKLIDGELSRVNPVGVNIYSNFLMEDSQAKKGQHAVTLIGRRYNKTTNECEYLIRNSWGTSCGYREFYCHPKNNRFDAGNIWVPKEKLMRFIYAMTYIEKP
jgi:hypothetical protein